jgi:hypothetical protein
MSKQAIILNVRNFMIERIHLLRIPVLLVVLGVLLMTDLISIPEDLPHTVVVPLVHHHTVVPQSQTQDTTRVGSSKNNNDTTITANHWTLPLPHLVLLSTGLHLTIGEVQLNRSLQADMIIKLPLTGNHHLAIVGDNNNNNNNNNTIPHTTNNTIDKLTTEILQKIVLTVDHRVKILTQVPHTEVPQVHEIHLIKAALLHQPLSTREVAELLTKEEPPRHTVHHHRTSMVTVVRSSRRLQQTKVMDTSHLHRTPHRTTATQTTECRTVIKHK